MKECNSCRYLQWVTTTDTGYFCAKHEIKVYSLDDLCTQYEPKKKTNADRIRSMTDEELAKYLAWLVDKQTCSPEWLIWLKEEVKGDGL